MAQTETKKELIDKYDHLIMLNDTAQIELNDWEIDFLDNIGDALGASDGFLTDRQIEKLEEVYNKYNG